jgi:outer membrane protein assembly factor BamB
MKLLALVLAAHAAELPPAPVKLWKVAWQQQLVQPGGLEFKPREVGGPAVDAVSGIVVAGTRDGFLRALDHEGGRAWSFEAGGRFDAAPRIHEDLVLAGCSDGKLYAVELGTGKVRWSYDAGEEVGTTPVVASGLVLFSTLQDAVVAVDLKTGAWKWRHRREPREGFTIRGAAAPVVTGGMVIAGYSDGFVAALDLQTGAVRWERRVAKQGDFMDVDGLRAEGGRVYAAAYSGAVHALEAASGKELWTLATPNPSRLASGGGVLVAVTSTQVLGIAPQDGAVRWTLPLQGSPAGEPVALGARAAVPNGNGLLWIDTTGGRLLRIFDPGTGVSATPAVRGRRVYVLSNGGDLFALDFL